MIEHIAIVGGAALWVALEVHHRILARRRSQALSTPIAREQELRQAGL